MGAANSLAAAREHGARLAARDVRLWGLDAHTLRYPVPLGRYAVASGIEYRPEPLWRHRRTAGVLCEGMVFVSGAASPEETRFTFAHELGHRRLETNHGEGKDPLAEAAADAYAGGLLVSEPVLRRIFASRGIPLDMPLLPLDLVRSRDEISSIACCHDGRQNFKVHVKTLVIALADNGFIEGETPFESHWLLLNHLSQSWRGRTSDRGHASDRRQG